MHTSGGITKSRKKEGKSEREKRKKRSKTLFMNQVIPVGKLRKNLYISIFKIYIYIYISIFIKTKVQEYMKKKEGCHDMMGQGLRV